MQSNTDGIQLLEQSLAKSTKPFICGHHGPEWFILNMYGEKSNQLDSKFSCPDCILTDLQQHSIRCARCGRLIAPGNGVSVVNVAANSFGPQKEVGTFINQGADALCCMKVGCYISGTYAGNWTREGFKPCQEGTVAWQAIETKGDRNGRCRVTLHF